MRDEFDEVETIDRNPKSWAAWKREAERLQEIIDGMELAAMDSEPVRNPVLAYADSYRDMAKQGVESVPIWSVITDLERNIAPLYIHAQQPVVPEEKPMPNPLSMYAVDAVAAIAEVKGWNACRAAMLAAAPQSQNAPQNIPEIIPGWIPVSERMPEPGILVLVYTPPQPGDYPGDVRIGFDYIDPDGDDPTYWFNHGESYEHFCCVACDGMTGPSEKAPYTHWMPLPAAPQEVK